MPCDTPSVIVLGRDGSVTYVLVGVAADGPMTRRLGALASGVARAADLARRGAR